MTDLTALAPVADAPAAEAPRTLFHIPQVNLEMFFAACKKLSRKAANLGFPAIVPVVVSEQVQKLHDGRKHRVSTVFLDAQTPRIDGWSFAATIDHSNESGNIVRTVPNSPALPTIYRTAEPHCEHCRIRRYRRDTYVLRNDDGETKQVGKSCLRDFFGHDPKRLAQMAEWLSQAAEAGRDYEEPMTGGASDRVYVGEFASYAATAVRLHGWVSAKVSQETDGALASTRSRATEYLYPNPKFRHLVPARLPEDYDLASAAMEWAAGLSETDGEMSDYEHSINVIAKSDFVERRSLGLVASIVGVFAKNTERELARRAEREAMSALPPSQHVGREKEILRDMALTVAGIVTLPDKGFGISYLVRMVDTAGNVFVWKSSNETDLSHQDRIVLKGTVKAHKEYEGTKQTWLSRCKFVPATASEG